MSRAVGVQPLLVMTGESWGQSSQGHSSGNDLFWEPGLLGRGDPQTLLWWLRWCWSHEQPWSLQPCAVVRGESGSMRLPLHLVHPQPDTPKEQSLRERCKRELKIPVPPLSTPG